MEPDSCRLRAPDKFAPPLLVAEVHKLCRWCGRSISIGDDARVGGLDAIPRSFLTHVRGVIIAMGIVGAHADVKYYRNLEPSK
jgi:hypothetical protein